MVDYDDALASMEKLKPAAVEKFKEYNPSCFCRAFLSTTIKVDVIVNNLAKTFNAYIISARIKHIMCMLEEIRNHSCRDCMLKKRRLKNGNTTLDHE